MALFEPSFAKTSVHEGGYANNPRDRGGETYRGIARNYWSGWPGWDEIDAAKLANKSINALKSKKLEGLVMDFYVDNFFRPLGCEKIVNQSVADEMFDTGVNMGVKQAVKFLQEAVGILGNGVTIDGVAGPKTITAANSVDPESLVRVLNLLQGAKYLDIVRRDPTQMAFLKGWLRRTGPTEQVGK